MVSRLNSQQGSMKYLLLLVKRGRYKPLHMKMLYEEFPDEAFQSQTLTFDSVWRIVVTRHAHRHATSSSARSVSEAERRAGPGVVDLLLSQ